MEDVETLAQDLARWKAERDPAWATTQGYPGFDAALADPSPAAYARELADVKGFIDRLHLASGPRLDRDALAYALELDRFRLERERPFERNPDLVLEIFDHLFPLLLRTERPLDLRVEAMTARLNAAAEYLARGRERLVVESVPPLWIDMARETIEAAPAFIEAVKAAGDRPALNRAADRAAEAIAEYAKWLDTELAPKAKGDWALGEALFSDLLAHRFLPFTPDALVELGERLVAETRAELKDAARTVLAAEGREEGENVIERALEVVRADHPSTFAEVLRFHVETVEAARAHVASAGLATLPTEAPLSIVETPSYLRHLVPFAAYVEPGRWDATARGTYLVTPKVDLGGFPRAEVRNTTVHEAYPGHHLQLALARSHRSLTRAFVGAPEMIEGWGLYSEALMARSGFTTKPSDRFVRLKDALWRALRIVLDVGLHTHTITFEDAVRRLSDETGMTSAEASAEVKRYTLTPTYNLSYMVGRIGLETVREKAIGQGMTERQFHDRVLGAGSLPLPLLSKAVLSG